MVIFSCLRYCNNSVVEKWVGLYASSSAEIFAAISSSRAPGWSELQPPETAVVSATAFRSDPSPPFL